MVAAVIALAFQLGPKTGDDTTPASTESQAEQSEQIGSEQEESEPAAGSIVLQPTTRVADELDPVRVTGSYPEASEGTRLTVQWSRAGEWVDLPLPTTVQVTGGFTTYVQLGEAGQQRVRVVDRADDTTSNAITLTIR